MALPNPLEAFTWGAGGARLTPEELAKRRQVEDALLARGVDTSPVGHWTQGLARVADAMAGSFRRGETDDASRQNASESQSLIAKLLSGGGGDAFPAAPGGGGQFPAAPVAGGGDYASQRVSQAHAVDLSGDKQAFVDALMPAALEASKRTGVDPRIIVAQAAQETGWGKSAPGNNYFGIKSHGKEGGQTFATHEVVNGQRVKINDSFRQFGSPGDSVAGYADFLLENPRYKPMMAAQGLDAQLQALGASGYATDPNYASSVGSIARGLPMPAAAANEAMATGQPIDPVQVASLDPSAGLSAAAPTSNGVPAAVSPQAQRVLATMMNPQPIGGALQAPDAPQQQVAQALMGSDTAALDQIPVMAGGNSGVGQPAQAAPQGINPAIIEALSSPYADAQTRQIAGILLKQSMDANDPATKLDMDYKRAQIAALNAKGAGGATEYGLNPQYGVDAKGNPVLIQIGKDGKSVQTALPQGVTLSKEPIKLDAGTHFVLLDPITRQAVGTIPKENRQEAFDKGIGGAEGKAVGEANIQLPQTIATAEQSLANIDAVINDPNLDYAVGAAGVLPAIPGTAQAGTVARIEQLQGAAFLQAFESLKGGGQITEVEGKKATDAIARLNRAQKKEDFVDALSDLRGIISSGLERARKKGGASAAPAAPTVIDGYTIEQVD